MLSDEEIEIRTARGKKAEATALPSVFFEESGSAGSKRESTSSILTSYREGKPLFPNFEGVGKQFLLIKNKGGKDNVLLCTQGGKVEVCGE